MTTLREKIETKWQEGLEAARHLIRAKVGENAVLGEPSSIYHYDLRREARGLEVSLDGIRDDVMEFLSKAATGPTSDKRAAQRQMELDDAVAARDARLKAEERAEESDAAKASAEVVSCDADLVTELSRVGATGLNHAVVRRPDGVLYIAVTGELPEPWAIEREAVRVLGAIRQLPDGAGDEAVRAILCGLAETAQADGEKTPDQIAESNIGFELERLDARSIAIEEVYPGDAGLMVRLRGPGMNFVVLRAGEAERELAELPNVTGAEATWQCLVNLDEGDQAELPAIERIHEALNRAGAPEIAIDSAGAAPGPEDVVVLRCAVEGRQHGERIGILTVEQILAVVEPIHAGAGSVAVWRALSWFADKVAKESRQGPPRRASAMGAVKRRGRKAADADAADVVVGGDSSEG